MRGRSAAELIADLTNECTASERKDVNPMNCVFIGAASSACYRRCCIFLFSSRVRFFCTFGVLSEPFQILLVLLLNGQFDHLGHLVGMVLRHERAHSGEEGGAGFQLTREERDEGRGRSRRKKGNQLEAERQKREAHTQGVR